MAHGRAYGSTAEYVAKIQTGDHVFIEGELVYREYERTIETDNGPVKVMWPVTEVVVESITVLERRDKQERKGFPYSVIGQSTPTIVSVCCETPDDSQEINEISNRVHRYDWRAYPSPIRHNIEPRPGEGVVQYFMSKPSKE